MTTSRAPRSAVGQSVARSVASAVVYFGVLLGASTGVPPGARSVASAMVYFGVPPGAWGGVRSGPSAIAPKARSARRHAIRLARQPGTVAAQPVGRIHA